MRFEKKSDCEHATHLRPQVARIRPRPQARLEGVAAPRYESTLSTSTARSGIMLIPAPSVSAVLDEPWRCHSRTPNAITATILIVDDCGCSESSQDVSNHHALMTLSLIKYETAVFSNTEHCGFFGMNHLRQCSRMRTFAKNPRCRGSAPPARSKSVTARTKIARARTDSIAVTFVVSSLCWIRQRTG